MATNSEKTKTAYLDVNPSMVEHLTEGYLAGVPVVAKDLAQQVVGSIGGDKWDFNKTPALNRFYKEYDEQRHFMSEYFKLRSMVKHWEGKETAEYKAAKRIVEDGWSEKTAAKINENKDVSRIKTSKGEITIRDGIKQMRTLRRKLVEQK